MLAFKNNVQRILVKYEAIEPNVWVMSAQGFRLLLHSIAIRILWRSSLNICLSELRQFPDLFKVYIYLILFYEIRSDIFVVSRFNCVSLKIWNFHGLYTLSVSLHLDNFKLRLTEQRAFKIHAVLSVLYNENHSIL